MAVMKQRPWRGTIPHRGLNQLHKGCDQRIRYEKFCPTDGDVEILPRAGKKNGETLVICPKQITFQVDR